MRTFRSLDSMANAIARVVGSPVATLAAVISVAALGLAGPFFHFSQRWQLVVNTILTLVTFLMVFLIQHTQNGDTAALHIKLDELIRVIEQADKSLLDLEHASHGDIESLRSSYHDLATKERDGATHIEHARRGDGPLGDPDESKSP
jgi:low affinity Fe/Cu permease